MARIFDPASSQYVGDGAATVNNRPITISAWIKPDVVNITQGIVSVYHTTSAVNRNSINLYLVNAALRIGMSNAFGETSAQQVTVSAGVWQHVAGTIDSSDSAIAYLNGSAGTPVTASRVPTPDATDIGRIGGLIPANYFDGCIGIVAIWNINLSAAEIVSLAKGYHPALIRPANLTNVWHLDGLASTERDFINRNTLQVTNGPTKVDGYKRIGIPMFSTGQVAMGQGMPASSYLEPEDPEPEVDANRKYRRKIRIRGKDGKVYIMRG